MDPMTVLMWIILGAVGGFLHWIIPTTGDKPDDLVEMVKRVVAGAIAVPLIMASGVSVYPQVEQFGYLGQVLLGYFSIDIWKMFRDYGVEKKKASTN